MLARWCRALEPTKRVDSVVHVVATVQEIVTDTGVFWNSGAEDVALIEYTKLTSRPFRAFSLDTRRLNPEKYRFFDTIEKHYRINIEYMFPDAGEIHGLVRSKGLFSFSEDGHQECCQVRKVRPLRRMLKGLRAWITGQRKDQSPGTRTNILVVQVQIYADQRHANCSLARDYLEKREKAWFASL
ncbi:hypothetical protein ZIOFF_028029 [Zingiber officinale]|uniref:Phosphoadenosine phosphosulphate reductase domain-containing protein n=1 Tax=Zingiber officinale TaxID=94328 RepID=A0A8J5GU86_ZINOF|nr:hypothetical protein ZIOFF_028029 [Zingiber officinale]